MRHLERSWTETDYLLAEVIDRLGAVVYTVAASNGGKPPRPKPFPRPGDKQQQRGRYGNRGGLTSEQAIQRLRLLQQPTTEQAQALAELPVQQE
jgi:hypothetical protein